MIDFGNKTPHRCRAKTKNGSGWQVVADLHFKNSAIKEKLFGKLKQCFLQHLPTYASDQYSFNHHGLPLAVQVLQISRTWVLLPLPTFISPELNFILLPVINKQHKPTK